MMLICQDSCSVRSDFRKRVMYLEVGRTQLYTLLCRPVGRSVSRLVGQLVLFLLFSASYSFLSILLLPGCPSDLLQYCYCLSACD